eukprot:g451.t1
MCDNSSETAATSSVKEIQSSVLFRVKARHTYTSRQADEMSFQRHDIIDVISKGVGDGWWTGVIAEGDRKGTRGLFPSNFVRKTRYAPKKSESTRKKDTPTSGSTSTPLLARKNIGIVSRLEEIVSIDREDRDSLTYKRIKDTLTAEYGVEAFENHKKDVQRALLGVSNATAAESEVAMKMQKEEYVGGSERDTCSSSKEKSKDIDVTPEGSPSYSTETPPKVESNASKFSPMIDVLPPPTPPPGLDLGSEGPLPSSSEITNRDAYLSSSPSGSEDGVEGVEEEIDVSVKSPPHVEYRQAWVNAVASAKSCAVASAFLAFNSSFENEASPTASSKERSSSSVSSFASNSTPAPPSTPAHLLASTLFVRPRFAAKRRRADHEDVDGVLKSLPLFPSLKECAFPSNSSVDSIMSASAVPASTKAGDGGGGRRAFNFHTFATSATHRDDVLLRGACLTIYEVTNSRTETIVLMLLGPFPYYSAMEHLLRDVYAAISTKRSRGGEYASKLVQRMLNDIPTPGNGVWRLHFRLRPHGALISLQRPPRNTLPGGAEMDWLVRTLFSRVESRTLLTCYGALLTETKIILASKDSNTSSACAEALRSLLYPLVWARPFLPCLPVIRKEWLWCPKRGSSGCIIGTTTEVLHGLSETEMSSVQRQAVVLYVDTGRITLPPNLARCVRDGHSTRKEEHRTILPEKIHAKLMSVVNQSEVRGHALFAVSVARIGFAEVMAKLLHPLREITERNACIASYDHACTVIARKRGRLLSMQRNYVKRRSSSGRDGGSSSESPSTAPPITPTVARVPSSPQRKKSMKAMRLLGSFGSSGTLVSGNATKNEVVVDEDDDDDGIMTPDHRRSLWKVLGIGLHDDSDGGDSSSHRHVFLEAFQRSRTLRRFLARHRDAYDGASGQRAENFTYEWDTALLLNSISSKISEYPSILGGGRGGFGHDTTRLTHCDFYCPTPNENTGEGDDASETTVSVVDISAIIRSAEAGDDSYDFSRRSSPRLPADPLSGADSKRCAASLRQTGESTKLIAAISPRMYRLLGARCACLFSGSAIVQRANRYCGDSREAFDVLQKSLEVSVRGWQDARTSEISSSVATTGPPKTPTRSLAAAEGAVVRALRTFMDQTLLVGCDAFSRAMIERCVLPLSRLSMDVERTVESLHAQYRTEGKRLWNLKNGVETAKRAARIGRIREQWLRKELRRREHSYIKKQNFRVIVATWNINAQIPDDSVSLAKWLKPACCSASSSASVDVAPDIVVVGLQEMVELNMQHVMMDGSESDERGRMWTRRITIELRQLYPKSSFKRIKTKVMVGCFIAVFVAEKHVDAVRSVSATSDSTGLGGMFGNKGAVAVRFRIYESTLAIVCAHLAAHRKHVDARNSDFAHIRDNLRFSFRAPVQSASQLMTVEHQTPHHLVWPPVCESDEVSSSSRFRKSSLDSMLDANEEDVDGSPTVRSGIERRKSGRRSSNKAYHKSGNIMSIISDTLSMETGATKVPIASTPFGTPTPASSTSTEYNTIASIGPSPIRHQHRLGSVVTAEEELTVSMLDHDTVIFFGDLNYRITTELSKETVLRLASSATKESMQELREHDQLNIERNDGRVFQGFHEGPLRFPPTYKMQIGTAKYDQREGKKIRAPAWCDRVLWHCRAQRTPASQLRRSSSIQKDHVELLAYDSVPSLTYSDHLPVYALLRLEVRVEDPKRKVATLEAISKKVVHFDREILREHESARLQLEWDDLQRGRGRSFGKVKKSGSVASDRSVLLVANESSRRQSQAGTSSKEELVATDLSLSWTVAKLWYGIPCSMVGLDDGLEKQRHLYRRQLDVTKHSVLRTATSWIDFCDTVARASKGLYGLRKKFTTLKLNPDGIDSAQQSHRDPIAWLQSELLSVGGSISMLRDTLKRVREWVKQLSLVHRSLVASSSSQRRMTASPKRKARGMSASLEFEDVVSDSSLPNSANDAAVSTLRQISKAANRIPSSAASYFRDLASMADADIVKIMEHELASVEAVLKESSEKHRRMAEAKQQLVSQKEKQEKAVHVGGQKVRALAKESDKLNRKAMNLPNVHASLTHAEMGKISWTSDKPMLFKSRGSNVFVSSIPKDLSARTKIRVGHLLLAVNGVRIVGQRYSPIRERMRKAVAPVNLRFGDEMRVQKNEAEGRLRDQQDIVASMTDELLKINENVEALRATHAKDAQKIVDMLRSCVLSRTGSLTAKIASLSESCTARTQEFRNDAVKFRNIAERLDTEVAMRGFDTALLTVRQFYAPPLTSEDIVSPATADVEVVTDDNLLPTPTPSSPPTVPPSPASHAMSKGASFAKSLRGQTHAVLSRGDQRRKLLHALSAWLKDVHSEHEAMRKHFESALQAFDKSRKKQAAADADELPDEGDTSWGWVYGSLNDDEKDDEPALETLTRVGRMITAAAARKHAKIIGSLDELETLVSVLGDESARTSEKMLSHSKRIDTLICDMQRDLLSSMDVTAQQRRQQIGKGGRSTYSSTNIPPAALRLASATMTARVARAQLLGAAQRDEIQWRQRLYRGLRMHYDASSRYVRSFVQSLSRAHVVSKSVTKTVLLNNGDEDVNMFRTFCDFDPKVSAHDFFALKKASDTSKWSASTPRRSNSDHHNATNQSKAGIAALTRQQRICACIVKLLSIPVSERSKVLKSKAELLRQCSIVTVESKQSDVHLNLWHVQIATMIRHLVDDYERANAEWARIYAQQDKRMVQPLRALDKVLDVELDRLSKRRKRAIDEDDGEADYRSKIASHKEVFMSAACNAARLIAKESAKALPGEPVGKSVETALFSGRLRRLLETYSSTTDVLHLLQAHASSSDKDVRKATMLPRGKSMRLPPNAIKRGIVGSAQTYVRKMAAVDTSLGATPELPLRTPLSEVPMYVQRSFADETDCVMLLGFVRKKSHKDITSTFAVARKRLLVLVRGVTGTRLTYYNPDTKATKGQIPKSGVLGGGVALRLCRDGKSFEIDVRHNQHITYRFEPIDRTTRHQWVSAIQILLLRQIPHIGQIVHDAEVALKKSEIESAGYPATLRSGDQ